VRWGRMSSYQVKRKRGERKREERDRGGVWLERFRKRGTECRVGEKRSGSMTGWVRVVVVTQQFVIVLSIYLSICVHYTI